MPSQRIFLYETSRQTTARKLEKDTNALLKASAKDVRAVLKNYGAPETAARPVSRGKIAVSHKGAGLGAETVALAVSLVPLIHVLRPLLMPWSKNFARVSEKVALDIWGILRDKLWKKKHVRLEEVRRTPESARKGATKPGKRTRK